MRFLAVFFGLINTKERVVHKMPREAPHPLPTLGLRLYIWTRHSFIHFKTILMNKSELVDAIAAGAGLSKADAARALDATTGAIHGALKSGDRVSLVGFGSFSVSKRAARTGRNPQTGAEIQIAAKNVVKFKAGAGLTV